MNSTTKHFYDSYKHQCTSDTEFNDLSNVIAFPSRSDKLGSQDFDNLNSIDRGLLEEVNMILGNNEHNPSMRGDIFKENPSNKTNKLPWGEQFIIHFTKSYNDIKKFDIYNILSLDKNKLLNDFPQNYENYYNEINEVLYSPDRHKVIALLTKAFLDAEPFYCNMEKADSLLKSGKKLLRLLVFPNEVLAIDICTTILTAWGRINTKNQDYEFIYPENVYIFAEKTPNSSFEYELFLIYRHYTNFMIYGKETFSIYQMANVYFLLEMGCDIAKYGKAEKYYGHIQSKPHNTNVNEFYLPDNNIPIPIQEKEGYIMNQAEQIVKEIENILDGRKLTITMTYPDEKSDNEYVLFSYSISEVGIIATGETFDETISNAISTIIDTNSFYTERYSNTSEKTNQMQLIDKLCTLYTSNAEYFKDYLKMRSIS